MEASKKIGSTHPRTTKSERNKTAPTSEGGAKTRTHTALLLVRAVWHTEAALAAEGNKANKMGKIDRESGH